MSIIFVKEVPIELDGYLYAPKENIEYVGSTDGLRAFIESFPKVEYNFFVHEAVLPFEFGEEETNELSANESQIGYGAGFPFNLSTRDIVQYRLRTLIGYIYPNLKVDIGSFGIRHLFLLSLDDEDLLSVIERVGYPELLGSNSITSYINSLGEYRVVQGQPLIPLDASLFIGEPQAYKSTLEIRPLSRSVVFGVDAIMDIFFVGKPKDYMFGVEDFYTYEELKEIPKIFLLLRSYLSDDEHKDLMKSIKSKSDEERYKLLMNCILKYSLQRVWGGLSSIYSSYVSEKIHKLNKGLINKPSATMKVVKEEEPDYESGNIVKVNFKKH